jgi:polyhydroxyalkanoate synthesis regulator phasin
VVNLFGFEISRKRKQEEVEDNKTFALPQNDDGAVTIQSGAYYGTYVDLDGVVRNEIELITRYREMAMQPELETAIDEIVNEAIVNDDTDTGVDIDTDELKQADKIKKAIREEFDIMLKLLNFGNMGHEIFRRWYIDGRLFYHIILDEKNPRNGIKELRYIDPRRIRKVREVQKTRDPRSGIELIKKVNEYYLYNERGVIGTHSNLGAKIATDSIVNVNSGLMDSKRAMVLSYLHKAIKPLNQLRMVEDATVIYRLSRAPERRIFYIDVGNMPTIKAEQYLKDVMTKYRNKLVYDSNTGEIKDDRKHLSMLEDFWLPRREGGKGTEITTLPGGQNLGEMEDVKYFEKKLYKALGVPVGRLEQQPGGGILGRSTEITRDELKFTKFIQRLRNKFSTLFDDLLRIQLVTKGICTEEEWKEFKEDIWYDFKKDNNFTELKEAELIQNRIQTLQLVDPYVGRYYSMEWVRKNILMMDDDEIEEMKAQIEEEQASLAPSVAAPPDIAGNPLPIQPNVPPPTPLQSMNAAKQDIAPPIEDGSTKLQENPLFDKRQMRFINDSLEIVK